MLIKVVVAVGQITFPRLLQGLYPANLTLLPCQKGVIRRVGLKGKEIGTTWKWMLTMKLKLATWERAEK
jgi:hypothetical protein